MKSLDKVILCFVDIIFAIIALIICFYGYWIIAFMFTGVVFQLILLFLFVMCGWHKSNNKFFTRILCMLNVPIHSFLIFMSIDFFSKLYLCVFFLTLVPTLVEAFLLDINVGKDAKK